MSNREWSKYQTAVFDNIENSNENLMVAAL